MRTIFVWPKLVAHFQLWESTLHAIIRGTYIKAQNSRSLILVSQCLNGITIRFYRTYSDNAPRQVVVT